MTSATILSGGGSGGNRRKGDDSQPVATIPRCSCGFHPSSKKGNPSLATILVKRSTARQESNRQVLTEASTKAKEHIGESQSMEMLYHLEVVIPTIDYDRETHSSFLVDQITSILAEYGCNASSIVYAAVNDMFLFDRYQSGIVLSRENQELLLFGGLKRRSISVGEYKDRYAGGACTNRGHHEDVEEEIVSYHQSLVRDLPGHILAYILMFLPESAPAMMNMVCKSWKGEIANAGQGLWQHYMDRNNWPYNHVRRQDLAPETVSTTFQDCRSNFRTLP